ncbi:MAG: hypothetical protein BIFFINMI_00322 [Phycisphaerae bacterium]|nr:hypothetical protein [Phycisphaerae bacterium]
MTTPQTGWETHLQIERRLHRRPGRRALAAVVAIAAVLLAASLAILGSLAGCQGVAPGAVRADVDVPVASPQAGEDQTVGVTVKPSAQVSQPNEQRADAGRTTVSGEGNRTVVVPVNVSGSAWGIVAAIIGIVAAAGLLIWERRRHKRTRAAAGTVCRAIRDLPAGPRRDRLLGMIERRSEAAGVRDDLDRLADRANARVQRSVGRHVAAEPHG